VNTTQRLVVDCGNVIIVDNKVPGLLHNSFGGFNDNSMHVFNHLPTSGIKLMFTWSVFYFQDIKEFFHVLKKFQRLAKFQKLEDGQKLDKLALLLISFNKTSHHFINIIFTPTSPQMFILGMLTVSRHKILPHSESKMCNLALPPTSMLL
jgi:hypothetical protein